MKFINHQTGTVEVKICPKCGSHFECLHDKGCWCENYQVSGENLKRLKAEFENCLCENCLKQYADGN